MKTLYQNTRAARVRFLQIALWAFALGVPALLAPQVGAGQPDALMLIAALTPIFILLAIGMEFYRSSYVLRLADLPGGLALDTLGTFGRRSRVVSWHDVELGRDFQDVFHGVAAPSVNNCAVLLRLASRRLPLIVDTTRDELDVRALRQRIARRGQTNKP
jgi:hypothetical protein